MNPAFWRDKRVLLTGHTGFKGAWLALWLEMLGADVTGFALPPATTPSLFESLQPWSRLRSVPGDVCDKDDVARVVERSRPEVVIHMAAQSLVRESYRDPVATVATNVLGTAHLLDAVRSQQALEVVLVVTSDKVYDQEGPVHDFVESDRLGGSDPYSASKAAQDVMTRAFARAFLEAEGTRVATARAGNVIGGGDWAAERLVPDFVRAHAHGRDLTLRNPGATRPWQHVVEPLAGYLTYIERLARNEESPRTLNFGPEGRSVPVGEVVAELSAAFGSDVAVTMDEGDQWPEHQELRLDVTAATKHLEWKPRLGLHESIRWTADWYLAHAAGADMRSVSMTQIDDYTGLE